MTTTVMPTVIPTNPEDLKNIRLVIEDISNAMTIAEDRRSYVNDAKKGLKEKYELDSKSIGAMIRWYHKSNSDETHDQLDLYEAVFPND